MHHESPTKSGQDLVNQFRAVRERNLFQHHYITLSALKTILLLSSTPSLPSQSVSLARSLINTFLTESARDMVVKGNNFR